MNMSEPKMVELRRAVAAAVRDAALVINAEARPWLREIAAHHGISRSTLRRELRTLGIIAGQTGPFSRAQADRHLELLPHIDLEDAIKERVAIPAVDELLDSYERWGIEGMIDEYSVDEATIRRWLSKARKATT